MARSKRRSMGVHRWRVPGGLGRLSTVASTVALATLLLSPQISAAASGSGGVTNFYRLTYQGATSATNASRYQFIDLGYGTNPSSQATTRQLIASIHSAQPQTRLLLYKTTGASASDAPGIVGCTPWNSAQPYGGVPTSWFLVDANGVPMYNSTYHYYELDPGNPQVQQACLSSAVSLAKQAGYNGVFWDMVSTSLHWAGLPASTCGTASCQSDTNWHAAMASFVTNLSAGLHAQGLLSIGNISGGALPYANGGPAYWQAFQQDGLDGAQEESFTSGTNHAPVGLAQWQQDLANEAWNEANGKYFLGNADVPANQALNTYGLATMLLAAQGRSSWDTANGSYGAAEYWFPEYDTALKLGQPLGAYTVQADGLYVRRFLNGTVIVNPTTSTVGAGAYGNLAAQSGLIALGPAKYAGATSPAPPAAIPPAKKGPRPKRSPRPKKLAPQLSGLTYAGRGVAGVKVFAGETAFFGAAAHDPNGRHHLSYGWSWGDGTAGCVAIPAWACRGASVAHIFRRPGRYTVTLTVANRAGQRVARQMPMTIHRRPPWTVFAVVRALHSSVVMSSRARGEVALTLVLPSAARHVVGVIRIAGCGMRGACVSAAPEMLSRVGKRNLKPGLLRLLVRATNRPLLRRLRVALSATPRRTLPAMFAIEVRLADRTSVRILQSIRLRF